MNFTVGNGQFRGACSALAPLEALKRTCCRGKTQKAKAERLPSSAIMGFRSLDRICALLKTALANVRRAENKRRQERATS